MGKSGKTVRACKKEEKEYIKCIIQKAVKAISLNIEKMKTIIVKM